MKSISKSNALSRLVCALTFGLALLLLLVAAPTQTSTADADIPDPCPIIVCVTEPCGFPLCPRPTPKPLPSPPPLLGGGPSPGQILISEFRLRGPEGPDDEFVELYNNTNAPITVTTNDGSAGWALVASDGVVRFIVPNGTVIPKRGHYLGANVQGYSLAQHDGSNTRTATADSSYTLDIPDAGGLALFGTSNPANFTLQRRLDAAGYAPVAAIYREGDGFPAYGAEMFANMEYSFYRNLSGTALPKDTDDNIADFIGVDPNLYNTSQGQHLGSPGPENLSSPVVPDNTALQVTLLDPAVTSTQAPNYVRDTTPDPANNSTYGTLLLRRKITNTSNDNITNLRVRVIDISTYPAPDLATSDMRVRSLWDDSLVTLTNGNVVTVRNTYMPTPPWKSYGGGFNTILRPTGISPAQPLAPGQSVNVGFLLGVQQNGIYRFYITVEVNYNEPPQSGTVDH
jgi:hypothetical protein